MSELSQIADELKRCGDILTGVSDALAALFKGNETEEARPKAEPSTPNLRQITKEQVRAALAVKSGAGFNAEVRALLEKHGAPKLSEIDPKEYASLLLEAEALGNE